MSNDFKFRNVNSGYAEIYFTKKDILTVVEKKRVVKSMDLENDEFKYTYRWFAYVKKKTKSVRLPTHKPDVYQDRTQHRIRYAKRSYSGSRRLCFEFL